jgi:hypothetical protein
MRFLRRHEHGRGQAQSLGGVAETFDARNRGARVQAMDMERSAASIRLSP